MLQKTLFSLKLAPDVRGLFLVSKKNLLPANVRRLGRVSLVGHGLGASVAALRLDGARHDERTVAVPVPVVVQLEGSDGTLEERELDVDDALTVLSMTEAAPVATIPTGSARQRSHTRPREEAVEPTQALSTVVAEAPLPPPAQPPTPTAAIPPPPVDEHPRRLPGGMLPL